VSEWLLFFTDEGHISLALTRESLHRRNIKFFGPTTLRATVCHNLLRLAELQPGDIVVDPLAGGGSICVEVSSNITINSFIARKDRHFIRNTLCCNMYTLNWRGRA